MQGNQRVYRLSETSHASLIACGLRAYNAGINPPFRNKTVLVATLPSVYNLFQYIDLYAVTMKRGSCNIFLWERGQGADSSQESWLAFQEFWQWIILPPKTTHL